MDTCVFTWDELYRRLAETIELFQEYRDQYGYNGEQAKQHAVLAMLETLNREHLLHERADEERQP